MYIPREFYYFIKGSNKYYSKTSGILDAARAAAGHSDMLARLGAEEEKPKTIIYSHSYSFFDVDDYDTKTCLEGLIANGFKVYFWVNGDLELLRDDNLDYLFSINNIAESSPDEILSVASKRLKQNPKQLLVFENYWVDHLVMNPTTRLGSSNIVKISDIDFSALSGDRYKAQIAYLKKQLIEPLIIIDEFSDRSDSTFKRLEKEGFSKFKIEISKICIDCLAWVEHFVRKCRNVPGAEDYFNYDLNFDWEELTTFPIELLKSLKDIRHYSLVDDCFSTQNLEIFFREIGPVRRIEVTEKILAIVLSISDKIFPALVDLFLDRKINRPVDLNALAKIYPNLENLDIWNSNFETIEAECLKNLKFCYINNNLSFTTLQELFLAAPNLSKLKLIFDTKEGFNDWLDKFLLIAPNSLGNLKKLSITTSNSVLDIDKIDIQKFFNLAPSLKKLSLANKEFQYDWSLPAITPSKLTIKRNIPQDRAKAEIKKTSPQALNFIGSSILLTNNTDGTSVFTGLNLPNLENVKATPNFKEKIAEDLFLAAPNLRNRAEIEKGFEKHIKPGSQPNLELLTTFHLQALAAENKHHLEQKIDADTKLDPNKQFKLKRIFYSIDLTKADPPINEYRISAFSNCDINQNPCALEDAFSLHNKKPLELKPVEVACLPEDVLKQTLAFKSTNDIVYGKQELILSSKWQPLASLSASEKVLHYHTDPNVKIEFAYSERDNMHYVRSSSHTPEPVTIDFALVLPKTSNVGDLPRDIQTKITTLKHFGSGPLKFNKKYPTGKDYLAYLNNQEKGACRHRGLVFLNWMQEKHPKIPVRIITNDCHAFAEVFYDNTWVRCDLGGYEAKLDITEAATTFNDKEKKVRQEILSAEGTVKPNPFKGYFQTKPSEKHTSLLSYFLKLMSTNKSLIVTSSDKDILALNLALRQFCRSTGRPSYYIHSADEISCQRPYIQRNKDNSGSLKKGPGGPLSEFLDEAEYIHSVSHVNYNNFKDDEFVNTNSFLDKEPLADGKPIPQKTIRIGLVNGNKIDLNAKRDFTSRFDSYESLPIPPELLDEVLQDHAPDKLETLEDPFVIPLYHGTDWKELLLGQPKLSEKGFLFSDGLLKQALDLNRPLVFSNPPMNNEAFEFFCGCLRQDYPRLKFAKVEGYNWKELKDYLVLDSTVNGLPLNPTNFSELFEQYSYQEDKKTYIAIPGKIENFPNKTLELYLTRGLDGDSWARILERAKIYQIKIQVSLAPGVKLPEELELNPQAVTTSVKTLSGQALSETVSVIESTEPDTSLEQILASGDWTPIDISECTPSNLLLNIETDKKALEKDKPELLFTQTPQLLISALEKGESVVLTGKPNDELIDALSIFILERAKQGKNVKGRLLIITDANDESPIKPFSCFPIINRHEVTKIEQEALIGSEIKSIKPLSLLNAHLKRPNGFKGFDNLRTPKLASFEISASERIAAEVTLTRQALIDEALKEYPFAFVAGLSGIGKSTFVDEELKGYKLFSGEDKFMEWALSFEENPLLVIDEANLTKRQWSELEGLFHKPPKIRINGELKTVSPNHKVLFIGNPLSYSVDRELATLFKRRGGALVFEPLPLAFVYERILRPMIETPKFTNLPTQDLCKPFLDVYRYLCDLSNIDVLITARELEMMALLTRNYCTRKGIYERDKVLKVAKYYAYEVAKDLAPSANILDFQEQFAPEDELEPFAIPPLKNFTLTDSRKKPAALLQECISLREAKQKAKSPKLKSGGLNGIIIEGQPGIGKSELVFSMLKANGYEKASLENPIHPPKPFYYLPANWSYENKEALLLKAFHEGAVVVIDEINATESLERILNSLMSGKDLNKNAATTPGFFVIGTQNPATMPGRRQASTAFLRRFLFMELPNYNIEEMISILTEKCKQLDSSEWYETITQIVEAFREDYALAVATNSENLPSFREAERLIEKLAVVKLALLDKELTSKELDHELTPTSSIPSLEFFEAKKPYLKIKDQLNQLNITEDKEQPGP